MTREIDTAEGPALEVGADAFRPAIHDGTITISNPATGNHRTFRIRTARKGALEGKRVVSLLIGPDNGSDYQGFGFVNDDGTVTVWHKHCGPVGAPSDFEKFARLLSAPEYFAERSGLEYLASLACRRCGRPLTRPDSIELGIGPVCAGRE